VKAHTAYLGLGSNLGDRAGTLEGAVRQLQTDPRFTLLRRAGTYASRAIGKAAGGEFLNTAASCVWNGTPAALLGWCQTVEQAHGRTRPYANSPRTLDIDVLWIDDVTVDLPELRVPHPRLLERAFALVPLLDLAPHLTTLDAGLPLSGWLSTELLHQGIATAPPSPVPLETARV
jgi:2-amino-4-hydroxy-6-hydroxymethyldihydropteridine diphosphokinase